MLAIIKATKSGMLVTRSPEGQLNSRAMAPASTDKLALKFIYNLESGKTEDVEDNGDANVSFYDTSSTSWVSIAGKAKIVKDKSVIKELWHPATSAWFGDLKDGKHDGTADDPRVAALSIEPIEVRAWVATRTKIGLLAEVVSSAITGDTAAPGKLITLKDSELKGL